MRLDEELPGTLEIPEWERCQNGNSARNLRRPEQRREDDGHGRAAGLRPQSCSSFAQMSLLWRQIRRTKHFHGDAKSDIRPPIGFCRMNELGRPTGEVISAKS